MVVNESLNFLCWGVEMREITQEQEEAQLEADSQEQKKTLAMLWREKRKKNEQDQANRPFLVLKGEAWRLNWLI